MNFKINAEFIRITIFFCIQSNNGTKKDLSFASMFIHFWKDVF